MMTTFLRIELVAMSSKRSSASTKRLAVGSVGLQTLNAEASKTKMSAAAPSKYGAHACLTPRAPAGSLMRYDCVGVT